ncbi:MAG: cobyrinate a,c-diamide synthase, partial [Nitrospiraceae bacterium]
MSNQYIPRIVVAGLRGGSGKTIVSLSLISVLRQKGLVVSPFKKGPDYIDAGWLARASGVPCYNLDLFMMTSDQVTDSFCSRSGASQISVIEGNRGLYDGIDAEGSYSTAELAKHLMSPVILAVDCTKTTSTIAAMILGCQKMDPAVSIGGVVLNRLATARQERVIRKAIEKTCGISVLGAIPRLREDPFPERHMGLVPFQERTGIEESLLKVREIGEKYLDYNAIIKVAGVGSQGSGARNQVTELKLQPSNSKEQNTISKPACRQTGLRIGIIRDSAFQFYYQENFEELEKRGAKLVEVSPLRDEELPLVDA